MKVRAVKQPDRKLIVDQYLQLKSELKHLREGRFPEEPPDGECSMSPSALVWNDYRTRCEIELLNRQVELLETSLHPTEQHMIEQVLSELQSDIKSNEGGKES